jgi:hypothetical protein
MSRLTAIPADAVRVLDQRWNPATSRRDGFYEFLTLGPDEEAPVWRTLEQMRQILPLASTTETTE